MIRVGLVDRVPSGWITLEDQRSERFRVAATHHQICLRAIKIGALPTANGMLPLKVNFYPVATPFDKKLICNVDTDEGMNVLLQAVFENDVVALPIGLPETELGTLTLTNAIKKTSTAVFASAGNTGGSIVYPAKLPCITSVGASLDGIEPKTRCSSDHQWWWASNGSYQVDVLFYCRILAETGAVYSVAMPEQQRRLHSGTSIAASLAAGVYARLMSTDSCIRVGDVRWPDESSFLRSMVELS